MIFKKIVFLFLLFYVVTAESNASKFAIADSERCQRVRNIVFFSKIYGNVRYFYPSKAALKLNWDKFAVYGVREVEECKNDQELITAIMTMFLPICPDLKINELHSKDFQILSKYQRHKAWEHSGSGTIPLAGVSRFVVKTFWPYSSKIIQLSNNDTLFFINENVDDSLGFSLPSASSCIDIKSSFWNLKNKTDSISIDKIDFKNHKYFITARNKYCQLVSIISTWNNMRFFHPYSKENNIDWDSLLFVSIERTYEAKNEIDFFEIFSNMLSVLNDGHLFTSIECSQKVDMLRTAQVYTYPYVLPIEVIVSDTVVVILNGEEEYLKKIPKGSVIDSVNGFSVYDWTNIRKNFMSGSKQRKEFMLKNEFFSNYNDSVYEISFTNSDGFVEEARLVGKRRRFFGVSKPDVDFFQEIKKDIYLLNFSSSKASRQNMKRTLAQLSKMKNIKGIIVDFRSPKYISHQLLSYFIDQEIKSPNWNIPVKSFPNKVVYKTKNWSVKPKRNKIISPLVFIVDASIISYGETIMQMVQYYNIGKIVGVNTAGCNGNATRFLTPVFNVWYYTGMHVENLDGSQLYNIGIKPDVYIENHSCDLINQIDSQMLKAIELIEIEVGLKQK
jgi:hypothetical protein